MCRLWAALPRLTGVLLILLAGVRGVGNAAPIEDILGEPMEPQPPATDPGPSPEPTPAGGPVGRIAGNPGVSPGGEAQYSIPLDLPRGTNGLTPQLSLEYRHAMPGGTLGAGWSLGGLSQVSRCRRTIAQDGAAGPVTQTRSDRFCLDGNRLVVVNGLAYGSAGAEYRTEIESFARIRSYGSAGEGPAYFVVETAGGLLMDYGATADSRIDWSGKVWTPRSWALSRIRDRFGNTIEFSYVEDGASGSFRVAGIRYNGNLYAGLEPTHEVIFRYENRPSSDVDLGYVAGSPVRQPVRLRRIDVLYNGSVLSRHELTYEASLSTAGNSRLASLRKCGVGASECLAPTVLTWQDGHPGLGPEGSHAVTLGDNARAKEDKLWWVADVNGDGRGDLVWAGGAADAATLRFRLANTAGGFGSEIDTGIGAPNGAGVPLDYDGDGVQDALIISASGEWSVVLGGANGLGAVVGTGITATGSDFRGADLDGDGLSDLAYTEKVGTFGGSMQVRVLYNRRGVGFSRLPVVLYEPDHALDLGFTAAGTFLGRPGQSIDLDGDGREDLMMNEIYSIARISADRRTSEHFDGDVERAIAADINGDGCTDVAYPHYLGNWRVRFSGCTVDGASGAEITGPAFAAPPRAIASIDWNGDGKEDLIHADGSANWKIVQSTGSSLLPVIDTGLAHESATSVAVADLDGDGLQDLASRSGSRLAYRLHEGRVPDLLLSVTDGFGVAALFEYSAATDPLVYTKSNGAAYPLRDLQDARTVVSRLSVSDGSGTGSMAVTGYTYAGLRSDATGRGDRGFAKRVATRLSPAPVLVIEDEYRQDFPFAGRNTRHVARLASGHPVLDIRSGWAQLSYGDGHASRQFPYLSSSREMRFDPHGAAWDAPYVTVTTSVAAIDSASGLVTDRKVTFVEGQGGMNPGASRSERIQHESVHSDTASWCLGRPTSTRVTAGHSLPGGAPVTRNWSQAWDMVTCRPTRQQVEPGDAQLQVTVDLSYDSFGNNSRRTVAGVGMVPRTSTMDWGTRGRFPIKFTNPLSQTTAASWEPASGLLASLTDPNGLTTRWTYDSFGLPAREIRADGTESVWSRVRCEGDCDSRARYRLRRDERDSTGKSSYSDFADLDMFDRSLRAAARSVGGAYSEQTMEYDRHGRLAGLSVPYWSGGVPPGGWRYDYDELGRLVAAGLRSASGSVERSLSYQYESLNSTQTDALGRQSTRRWTAWGDLAAVTDALGGTSRYDYDAFGHLLRVEDAAGNTTSSATYNARGIMTGQVDMDLGAWMLSTDALGEIVAWTDAKGQATAIAYDLLGRPVERREAEGVTKWTWGTSPASRNVGRLTSMSGPGYAESYSYDSLGRVSARKINSDASYEFSYAYDAAGQLQTLTYPVSVAGYRLRIGYEYEQGRPVRILDRSAQDRLLWQLGATDAAGNALDESLGSAVRVVSGFNPLTGSIDYRQAGAGGGTSIQDLSYLWDSAGNLRERRDLSRGLDETFGYDAGDRLEWVRENGFPGTSLRYDLLGNILWKSDVCPTESSCYSYDANRRHAVTKAGAGEYAYDANGNMTERNGSGIDWYSYNLPRSIAGVQGNLSQFWYDPLRNRWKQVAIDSGLGETTIYVGGLLEKVTRAGSTVWRHYVQGPGGTIAIHLRYGSGAPAVTYHPTHDHLGGVDRIVDSLTGAVLVSESFDAFGRRRGGDGIASPSAADWAAIRSVTRDGFTGHEHLDNLGLIHMNGRVYDPAIARFLSADPVVQDPYYGQDLNRYSYAWNAPLSVIDPSGLEEISCMHGPDGACQGVTVTGLRDGPAFGDTYMFQQSWHSIWNGQAAAAAERDPCGQDGSAMACAQSAAVSGSVQTLPYSPAPRGDAGGHGTAADYLQGLVATLGNVGMNSAPVFWLFPGDPETEWFPVPETVLGARGANTGSIGFLFSGLAGTLRIAATGAAKRTIASVGGLVRRFEQPEARVFYRAFSGDATVGSWLTAVPPRSQAWAQEALALPPWNKATHFQEVLVPGGTLLERSRAIQVPTWGRMRGGAEQFKLLEAIPEENFGPGRLLP